MALLKTTPPFGHPSGEGECILMLPDTFGYLSDAQFKSEF
jgi:hypothetical protein